LEEAAEDAGAEEAEEAEEAEVRQSLQQGAGVAWQVGYLCYLVQVSLETGADTHHCPLSLCLQIINIVRDLYGAGKSPSSHPALRSCKSLAAWIDGDESRRPPTSVIVELLLLATRFDFRSLPIILAKPRFRSGMFGDFLGRS
jgi:hypothetical protein